MAVASIQKMVRPRKGGGFFSAHLFHSATCPSRSRAFRSARQRSSAIFRREAI
jgi:hypothetical protein